MHYALKVWSDVTPLNFHEVAGSPADIQIDFSKADHNDRYPFDGPGGTVAHAFFPGDHHAAGGHPLRRRRGLDLPVLRCVRAEPWGPGSPQGVAGATRGPWTVETPPGPP